ncbi:hypothetical protein K438DRAFT_1618773 [Mycena galopus ATCC 62051]|nr:hypothetical protein K438DRAFT_1618773 [Mycena galopus ATCC 62051]
MYGFASTAKFLSNLPILSGYRSFSQYCALRAETWASSPRCAGPLASPFKGIIRALILTECCLFSRRGKRQNLIHSLNSSLLQTSDYLDLSRRVGIAIRFHNSKTQEVSVLYYKTAGSSRSPPFPNGCAGFLYYHRDPDAASLEGSVRFRVTGDPAPSSFHRGKDLLLASGYPWQAMLLQIACRQQYAGIREHLVAENLITEQQVSSCRSLFAPGKRYKTNTETTLFRLSQEFMVNFREILLTVIGDEALYPLRLLPFRVYRHRKAQHPWVGSAIVRFEPSTDPEHRGRRVICLRFVRIVTPISWTWEGFKRRIVEPAEGELLNVSFRGGVPKPWSFDLDARESSNTAGLRRLWDSARTL